MIQKGGGKKVLRIPPEVGGMIEDYLARRTDDSPWLWVSHGGGEHAARMRPAGVREIWVRLARRLHISKFTTHQIRHTTATELFEADVPDAVISKHLGHKSLQMLSVYRKVRDASRQKAVDAMAQIIATPGAEVKVPKRTRRASWSRLNRP